MKWERIEIGKVAKVISGFAFKSKDFQQIGIPIVKIKNIKDENIVLDESDCVDSSIDVPPRFHLMDGDILISLTGSHISLPSSVVGRVAKYRHNANSYLNQRAGKFINIDDKRCVKDYLFYFLLQKDTLTKIASKAQGAANQANISPGDVEGVEINLPPLPTQRKIASILSAYDDLIENNLKRIKLLEEKAQLHYRQYKSSEKFALQDLAEYLGRGITPIYEEGSGFFAINQKANKGSLLDYNQFKELDTKNDVPEEKFAKWGDLLINSLGEGTLGRVHFFTDKSDLYAVDQHISIFRTHDFHYTFYLYQFLSSDYGQGLIDSLKKGGTNMTMLNISDLRQLEVTFPKDRDLQELWVIAEPIYRLKQTLIQQNTRLREARDILLPKLMNGQIEIA
jgi:type I restriction enzyme S subunit